MKILVASINFAPDHSGIALYSTDLPVFFAEKGHQVTMVTGFPYYPQWRKRPEDRRKLFAAEQYKGVRVLRGYLYVPSHVTIFKRMLHEFSFNFFAIINFLRANRHDVIVIISPPLLLGLVGVAFKYLWRAQLVFHIQDLQPDAALSLGMVKPGFMTRTLLSIERFVYRHSDWVATITQGMLNRLVEKGVPRHKLGLYYNWIDVEQASRSRPQGRFRARYCPQPGKFIIAYAGNIGVKQGVDVLVDVADALKDDPRFRFFIIGDGADKPRLLKLAESRRLSNLDFLPFLSEPDYFEMLADVDLTFVAQRSGTGNVFFPSKLLGIMAIGRPLLVSADPDSELARVIVAERAGVVASAADVPALVGHIRRLAKDPAELERLGHNGNLSVRKFDRAQVLSGFLKRIVTTADARVNGLARGKETIAPDLSDSILSPADFDEELEVQRIAESGSGDS
jgi:colanic acid biosynthesis glycosyl transferase WcaI